MLFTELKQLIRKDKRLQILLLTALVVQVIMAITAIGIYHPDQHFQIIEFSSWQLHRASAASHVWEFGAHIRPTLQVYLFSAWYKTCVWTGIRDPYVQLTMLRIVFSLVLFVFFNGFTLYYLRSYAPKTIFYSLLILNFSWILPYTRTLYSSEMLSSLLFFGGLWLYTMEREKDNRWLYPLLTGLLFSFAFYARFQTGFAILGFGLWMILAERKGSKWLMLAFGFLAGMLVNVGLDAAFYHQWLFTPYVYYHVNIDEGVAASMGTSSFLVYIGVLLGVIVVPPLSLLLLFSGFRIGFLRYYKNPLFLSVVFFIIGHCLVAHKEERFLFPVLNVLPVLVGWGLPPLFEWYQTRKKGMHRFIKGITLFSVGLNALLLFVFMITPYSQALYFTWLLKKNFKDNPVTVYALPHSPFETDARLPFEFYRSGSANMTWKKIGRNDSLRYIADDAAYITTTYNQISSDRKLLDSLGYEKQLCSSELLWSVNEFLQSKGINTINDIWVLYKRKPR
jgi:phosphatidylinositol glycan class B